MRKLHTLNEDTFHEIEWKEGLAVVRFMLLGVHRATIAKDYLILLWKVLKIM